jgi:peptidoglycan/LPS O-acetylase OafA/YrhL
MREIKALTSMRGIFALWVLSYHLVVLTAPLHHNPGGFFGKGYLGVDFFFLLSGFVLAGAYGRNFGRWPSGERYLNFMICRAGRMYPLHLVVTAICVFTAWWYGSPYSPFQVAEESLLLHRWPFFPAIFQAINGHARSISSEMLANVAFPIFTFLLLASPAAVSAIGGLAAIAGIAALGYLNHGSLDLALANTLSPTVRCFCEFALGMLIYRWRAEPISSWIVAAFAATLGMAIILRAPDPVIVVLMIPVVFTVAANKGPISATLSAKPLHFLGELSFSIYLVHLPVIIAIQHFASAPFVVATLAIVVTLAVSLFTYRLFEVPARDRSKRFAADITARLGARTSAQS